MLRTILLAFIPIFVAVDALGLLPIYASITQGLNQKEKKKVIFQSILTAMGLAIGFIFLGKAVFKFLNITIGDFMVAGGLVLFCIALMDILSQGKKRKYSIKDLGSVPLGTPLIVGPAVLTTSLIIITEYGILATLVSVCLNVILAGIILLYSEKLVKFLGESGSKALSKIASLLLAAIAVMMIRKGLLLLILFSRQ